MSAITTRTSRKRLAAIITAKLAEHNIEAVLVGGALVSIYTDNKYESLDLDFITAASQTVLAKAMAELGFRRAGKDFVHPHTAYTVEFPSGPLGIGDDVPVLPEGKIIVGRVEILALSPTQSVMDRLAWFFFSHDRQCLDQAVAITLCQGVSQAKVKAWAMRERQQEAYAVYLALVRKAK